MTNFSHRELKALYSQHSIQNEDLSLICQLASDKNINIIEKAESWNFDQFLGCAFYLFVTVDSLETRQYIAQVLPKFGSRAVLPLSNILHRFPATSSVRSLAEYCLESIDPYSLLIGLTYVLKRDNMARLKPIVIQLLSKKIQVADEATCSFANFLFSEELLGEVVVPQRSISKEREQIDVTPQLEQAA